MKEFPTEGPPFRLIRQPETQHTLQAARAALEPVTAALAEESALFEGTVLYHLDRHHGDAAAVVSVDAPNVNTERLDFRRRTIDGHRVNLATTALGDVLRTGRGQFAPSRLNPDNHHTWTQPVILDGQLVGGVQFAFTKSLGGTLPSDRSVGAIWAAHTITNTEASRSIHHLSKSVDSLGDSLELLPPTTPNHIIVRWDIAESTPLATSSQYGALRHYQQQWQEALQAIVTPYAPDTIEEGDGQNIAIALPSSIDVLNSDQLRSHVQSTLSELLEAIERGHNRIAALYPDLHRPQLHIGAGIGHLEKDRDGRLTGPILWELGVLVKAGGGRRVLYSDALHKLLDIKNTPS